MHITAEKLQVTKVVMKLRKLDAGQLLGTDADGFPISFPQNGKLWEIELFLLCMKILL